MLGVLGVSWRPAVDGFSPLIVFLLA